MAMMMQPKTMLRMSPVPSPPREGSDRATTCCVTSEVVAVGATVVGIGASVVGADVGASVLGCRVGADVSDGSSGGDMSVALNSETLNLCAELDVSLDSETGGEDGDGGVGLELADDAFAVAFKLTDVGRPVGDVLDSFNFKVPLLIGESLLELVAFG